MSNRPAIPPPFPFPEAWGAVFEQKQGCWLTPWTALSFPETTMDVQQSASPPVEEEEEKAVDEEEYEYGFVLSEEWRKKFSERYSAPSADSKKKKKKKKGKRDVGKGKPYINRSLHQEIQASKQRERQYHKLCVADANPEACDRVQKLERDLASAFDQFCRSHDPVMWPQ